MKPINAEDFNVKYEQMFANFLPEKSSDSLLELLLSCDDDQESRRLIDDLLNIFNSYWLDERLRNKLLIDMSRAIKDKNYPADTTAIIAMAYDTHADGSQEILNQIKVPLVMVGVVYRENDTPSYKTMKDVKLWSHARTSFPTSSLYPK